MSVLFTIYYFKSKCQNLYVKEMFKAKEICVELTNTES